MKSSTADQDTRARGNARHDDEARLDAALEESFPASDPVAIAQPGSLVAERNATPDGTERFAAIAAGVAIAAAVVGTLRVLSGSRRGALRNA